MKKLLTALLCFTLTLSFAQVPAIQWQKSLGGTDSDGFNDIKQTADGGYIAIGRTYSSDGDVTSNQGGYDIWVVRLNVSGNLVWQKSLGGSGEDYGYSIAQSTDGGYILVGQSNSTDGDVTGNHGNYDLWVAKLNASGNLVWQKSLGGSGIDIGYSIVQTTDGGYAVTGESESTDGDVTGNHGSADYWVVKLDAAGTIVWQKSFGGTGGDRPRSIKQTTDGGYVVAGHAISNDGDVTGAHGIADLWVVKMDASGTLVWQKNVGGTGTDRARSVSQTANGGYILAGESNSIDGDVTGNHGQRDAWIVRISAAGNFLWQKSLGGTLDEDVFSVRQTADGGYIAIGSTSSLNGDVVGSHGGGDYWLVKLNASGSLIWQKPMGGSSSEYAYAIELTTDGGYVVAGSASTSSIGPLVPNNGDITGNHGKADGWIVKLEGCTPVSHTASITACDSYTWTPGNGQTYTSSTTATYTFVGGTSSGCDSTVTLNLTIGDAVSPVANAANLPDITNSCSVTSLTAPTATDNCAGTITGTHTITLPITTQGTTVVTWTYNDGHGNTTTQTQNVIITDNTQPIVSLANLPDISSPCSVTSLTAPTATDNCAGTINGTHNASLPITTQGTTTITWTYNDGHGNITTQNQNVIISPAAVPTTTQSGATITVSTAGATYQWINCGNGNTPISGATSQSFTATANGTYAVIVTQNGCSATSACVSVSVVGLEEVNQTLFTIYPNPNNGTFKVVTNSTMSTMSVRVTNASGQLVSTHQLGAGENTIELQDVKKGIYFITAFSESGDMIVERVSILK